MREIFYVKIEAGMSQVCNVDLHTGEWRLFLDRTQYLCWLTDTKEEKYE